ncbi:immunoglobulin-like domain-containing protein [Clostridium nigeriense]|uniref:immunoglobulin-like domain-containing protein n=1 Tax=Clostridium nigeriense TaxID=1805470 RepID=UPI000833BD19|nr:immunoglobulin-like domain-containing protein [Clostridium nigeriense]
MKKKKIKPSLKIALASTIAVTSAAAIVYATPEIIKTVASENNENKFILDIKNIDQDTIKVSLDNIEDIPKALQFSLKLDGVVLKENEGNPVIKDLVNTKKSDSIITDYSYNKDTNTIDVLITSQDSIPKKGNEIEVFELDIEKSDDNETRNYSVTAKENSEYKYISKTNKEYVKAVEVANKELSINTAPTITKKNENYIEVKVAEKFSLTKENLSNYIEFNDIDNDEITIEVKNVEEKVIEEFTSSTAGIYDIYVTAIDNFGAKSETLNMQVKVNQIEQDPIITRNDEDLKDITINAGEVFNLMDGIKAVDAIGNPVSVTVKSDKELNLDPIENTVYNITYTAIDNLGRKTEKTIQLTVKANKAPIIKGVKEEHILKVGDKFDPREGITVEDEDKDIKLVVESNVNTNIAGVYKVNYSATDSGNKTTRAQSIVIVNPKPESINTAPVINATDRVIQLGEKFEPLNGVSATDAEDGEINTINIVINEVNENIAGKYKVTYSVTDSVGASTIKTINVIVNDPPKINAEDKIIKVGSEFNPLSGVSASDKEDGNITKIEVLENNVDTSKEGEYKVKYSVVDSLGGKTTKTITIYVKNDIILADSITINNKIDSLYIGSSKVLTAKVDEKADIKDIEWSTSDESIASIEIIGNNAKVIAKSEGKVTITAKTKDGGNKSDSITIEISNYEDNVKDFIVNIIDTNVVIPVVGTGEFDSPVEMEVQNVSLEEFEGFILKFKDLNPILESKYEDGDYTVYKIRVSNNSIASKVMSLFASKSSEGYIELKIANNLDNKSEMISKLEEILTIEETPGEDNNQGGNEGTEIPGEDNNQAESENTEKPNKNTNSKLPATGQESILGVLGLLAVAIGGVIYKRKK